MTLDKILRIYVQHKFGLSANTIQQYRIAVGQFRNWYGKPVDQLHEQLVLNWLRSISQCRSPRTINNKRQTILTLWRFGFRRGLIKRQPPINDDLPKLREHKRIPTAWSIAEINRLLQACQKVKPVRMWDGRHWQALLLVIYDTSLRIGALLQTARLDVSARGFLICRAEYQKQTRDTVQRLHPQTLQAIDAMPNHPLLFPWPLHPRAIWRKFRQVLQAAELPATRRDLFHKLRRTSYTIVFEELGQDAASRHAGHSTDQSAAYYDPTWQAGKTQPVDVLPRPVVEF